jgi:putative iron-regulated protein
MLRCKRFAFTDKLLCFRFILRHMISRKTRTTCQAYLLGLMTSVAALGTNAASDQSDARAMQSHYVQQASVAYLHALEQAQRLDRALAELATRPNARTLQQARLAWRAARVAYLPTEVYRYFESPIDDADGPEGRINAWPLNEHWIEAYGAAVREPRQDLIGQSALELSSELLRARDQNSDEADVTTGFHAIEYLLWGPDDNPKGPGRRTAKAFQAADSLASRRLQYVRIVSADLVRDLQSVQAEWASDSGYGSQFQALESAQALRSMLQGLMMLAADELASERLQVALDSGLQEDETSCFSDQTALEYADGVRGIRAIWYGTADHPRQAKAHPNSVGAWLAQHDAARARAVERAIDAAEQAAKRVAESPLHFDQMLLSAADSAERQHAEALSQALIALAQALRNAGRAAQVDVAVPGTS